MRRKWILSLAKTSPLVCAYINDAGLTSDIRMDRNSSVVTVCTRKKSSATTAYRRQEKYLLGAARQRYMDLVRLLQKDATAEKQSLDGFSSYPSNKVEKSNVSSSALSCRGADAHRRIDTYSPIEENLFYGLGLCMLTNEIPTSYERTDRTLCTSSEASCNKEKLSHSCDPITSNDQMKKYKLLLSHIMEAGVKAKIPIKELMESFICLPWEVILRQEGETFTSSDELPRFRGTPSDIALMFSKVPSETLLHLLNYATEQWLDNTSQVSLLHDDERNLKASANRGGAWESPSRMSAQVAFRALENDMFLVYKNYFLRPLSVLFSTLQGSPIDESKEPRSEKLPSFFPCAAGKSAILEAVLLLCKALARKSPSFSFPSYSSESSLRDASAWSIDTKGSVEAGQWALHFFMVYWMCLKTVHIGSEASHLGFVGKSKRSEAKRHSDGCARDRIRHCFELFRILLEALDEKDMICERLGISGGATTSSHISFLPREIRRLGGEEHYMKCKEGYEIGHQVFSLFKEVVEWCQTQYIDDYSHGSMAGEVIGTFNCGKKETWNSALYSPILSQCVLSVIGPLSRTIPECSCPEDFSSSYLFYRQVKHIWELLLINTDLGYSKDLSFFSQDALYGLLMCLIRCFQTKTSFLSNSSLNKVVYGGFERQAHLPLSLNISDSETLIVEIEDLIRIHRENTSGAALSTSVSVRHSNLSLHQTKHCGLASNISNIGPAEGASSVIVPEGSSTYSEKPNFLKFTTAIYHALIRGFALSGRTDISFLLFNRLLSPGTRDSIRKDFWSEVLPTLLLSAHPRCCSPSYVLFGEKSDCAASEINSLVAHNEQVMQSSGLDGTLLENYENTLWHRILSFDAQGFFSSSSRLVKTECYHLVATALLVLRGKNNALSRHNVTKREENASFVAGHDNGQVDDTHHFIANKSKMKRVYYLLSCTAPESEYPVGRIGDKIPSAAKASLHGERSFFLRLLALHMEIGECLGALFSNPSSMTLSNVACNPEHLLKCLVGWTDCFHAHFLSKNSMMKRDLAASERSQVIPFPLISLLSEITIQLWDLRLLYFHLGKSEPSWITLLLWCQQTIKSWSQWMFFSSISSTKENALYARKLQSFEVPLLSLVAASRIEKDLAEKENEQNSERKTTFQNSKVIGIKFPSLVVKDLPPSLNEKVYPFSARLLTSLKSLEDVEIFIRGIGAQLEKSSKAVIKCEGDHAEQMEVNTAVKTIFFVVSMAEFAELLALHDIWIEWILSYPKTSSSSTLTPKRDPLGDSSSFFEVSSMEDVWNSLLGLSSESSVGSCSLRKSSATSQSPRCFWSLLVASPIEWETHFGWSTKSQRGMDQNSRDPIGIQKYTRGIPVEEKKSLEKDFFFGSIEDRLGVLVLRDACASREESSINPSQVEYSAPLTDNKAVSQKISFYSISRRKSAIFWLQDWTNQSFPFGEEEPFFTRSSTSSSLPSCTYVKWASKTLYSQKAHSLFFHEMKSPQVLSERSSTSESSQRCGEPSDNLPSFRDREDWELLRAYAKELSVSPSSFPNKDK